MEGRCILGREGGGAVEIVLLVGDEAFFLHEGGRAAVVGVVVVVVVDDGVDHDGLLVDCQGGVCGDCDPAFCFE